MSAHTPGPWVTYRGKVYHHEGITQWKSTVIRPVVNGRVMSISIAKCDNEGNARLIAAAPDLLEALKKALRVISIVCDPDEYAEPIKAIRAAIAKVAGEPA